MAVRTGGIEKNTGDCVSVEVIDREVIDGLITQDKNGW